MTKKKQHGGARPNSGPKPKGQNGPRRPFSFRIDPKNLEFLKEQPGTAGDYLNALLDEYRGHKTD